MYRFANKYGANVDGYSPIYTPDTWSETGSEYKLGTKGLLAWCAGAVLPMFLLPSASDSSTLRTNICSAVRLLFEPSICATVENIFRFE